MLISRDGIIKNGRNPGERFPWVVHGPAASDGMRENIDEFPQYRQAIQFAKAENKKYTARAELTEEKTHG